MTYKYIFSICCAILFGNYIVNAHTDNLNCAVTYEKWAGRFGDNLFLLAKAKWFSKKFNVPLLYKPFIHSDMLELHKLESHYQQQDLSKFKNIVTLTKIESNFQLTNNTLYIVPFYGSESMFTKSNLDSVLNDLQTIIKPSIPLLLIKPPANSLSIALHVRRGGGFDKPSLINNAPYKFPPDSFYTEQISKIADLFPNQTLYIYLFTDDKEPQTLVNKYKQVLSSRKIVWDYHKNNTNFDATTIDDFFSIMSFDCLIRPESSFSIWAQILGHHYIVISPKNAIKKDGKWFINEVAIKINY